MDEEKLLQYIKGEILSKTETIRILDWVEASPENQRKYTQLKNLWVIAGLDYPEEVIIPDFAYPQNKRKILHETFIGSFLKYAAIFLLAFSMGSLSLYYVSSNQNAELSSHFNTIEVPNGQRSQISLYDGTRVWLNSGTKFRYPVVFSKKLREVFIEGEAFFDVAKDKKHPFVVNAGQLKVEVMGTRFNVYAYPEEGEFSTTLEEGSVNMIKTSDSKGIVLKPGEQVIFDRTTDRFKKLEVNTELYTSWKENLLKFEDAPFDEVIKKMERWYDIKITVDPAVNTKERYTMTIKTESLREMLTLLSKTTKINYEIKVNSVLIKKP